MTSIFENGSSDSAKAYLKARDVNRPKVCTANLSAFYWW